MAKFRKKPVVVEAYQITRDLLWPILAEDAPYPRGLNLASASWSKEPNRIDYWNGTVTTIHEQETRGRLDYRGAGPAAQREGQ